MDTLSNKLKIRIIYHMRMGDEYTIYYCCERQAYIEICLVALVQSYVFTGIIIRDLQKIIIFISIYRYLLLVHEDSEHCNGIPGWQSWRLLPHKDPSFISIDDVFSYICHVFIDLDLKVVVGMDVCAQIIRKRNIFVQIV